MGLRTSTTGGPGFDPWPGNWDPAGCALRPKKKKVKKMGTGVGLKVVGSSKGTFSPATGECRIHPPTRRR